MGVSKIRLCICILMFTATPSSARRMAEEDGQPSLALPPPSPPPLPAAGSLKPGITVIVGAISTIFSITFLVLLYVQHCKTGALTSNSRVTLPLSRVDSGVNRKVIEQLPLFRFSSLRGQKDGLECSVCLTRFEAEEVLRLLPKCKHAFHVDCVDTWLDEHSTCPLCRYRVRPEDVLLVDCHGSHHKALYNYAAGSRRSITGPGVVSGRHSSAGEGGGKGLGVIAERRSGTNESKRRSSFDSWSSRRKAAPGAASRRRSGGQLSGSLSRRDGQLSVQGDNHRLEHRIVVSDGGEEAAAIGQRPGSEVQTEEVLYLRTEMLLLEGGAGEVEGEEVVSGSSSSSGSGSSSGKKLIDDRNATEIKEMRKSRSDVGERKGKEREEEGIVKKLLDWIPQFQQHHQQQQQKPAANYAASSSSSGPV